MPRFDLDWSWAGRTGTITGVDCRWQARGYALIGRNIDSVRSVTVDTVLPLDVGPLATKYGLKSGWGRILCEGRLVLSGRMVVAYGMPRNGSTPVELVIADDDRGDTGAWPPGAWAPPERTDDDPFTVDTTSYVTDLQHPNRYYPGGRGIAGLYPVATTTTKLRSDLPEFQGIPEPSEGQTLPYVIGAPGTSVSPGSPAYYFGEGTVVRLIVAGHRVAAQRVTIWGPRVSATDALNSEASVVVHHATLSGGGEYAFVYMYGADSPEGGGVGNGVHDGGNVEDAPQKRYWCSWTDGEATPGGAGDVLLSLARSSSVRFDYDALHVAAPTLNRYRLAGYLDSTVTPSEWLRQAILPLLPMAIVGGVGGLSPLLAEWLSGERAPAIPIGPEQGFVLADLVRERTGDRASAVSLEYGFRPDTSAYSLTVDASSATTGITTDGLDGVTSMQTRFVWDGATAFLMAADMLRVRAARSRTLRYTVEDVGRYGPGGTMELREGRTVEVTDAGLSLSRARGVITEIEIDPQGMVVAVDLRDDVMAGDTVS